MDIVTAPTRIAIVYKGDVQKGCRDEGGAGVNGGFFICAAGTIMG